MADQVYDEGFIGRLVKGEGFYRYGRILALLLVLAGLGWSGWQFRNYIEMSQDEAITIPAMEDLSAKDEKRLGGLIGDFKTAVDTRTRSLTLASAVIDASRQPFVITSKVVAARPGQGAEGGEGAATAAGEDHTITPYVREVIPPIMFVRAIMVAEKQAMAIMDIEGVGTGIIVRAGYSFAQGEGKVLRIGADKVTVLWSGKNIDIAPGL